MISKVAIMASRFISGILVFVGSAFSALSVFTIWHTISEWSNTPSDEHGVSIFVIVFFVLISFAVLYTGVRMRFRIRRFKRYVYLISYENKNKPQDFAEDIGKPVAFIKKDIQKMIRMKYFKNVQFSELTQELIISGIQDTKRGLIDVTGLNEERIACRGCGAEVVKKKNITVYCEYCGTAVR